MTRAIAPHSTGPAVMPVDTARCGLVTGTTTAVAPGRSWVNDTPSGRMVGHAEGDRVRPLILPDSPGC